MVSHTAAATGGSNTRFFVSGSGAPDTTGPLLYLDQVVVSGCARPNPPTLSKAFLPDPVSIGTASTLTFTFANPNASVLSGVGFSDTLPDGLKIATPNGLSTITCTSGSVTVAPTITATQNTSFISMSGASLSANAAGCKFSVNVVPSAAGAYHNVSSSITSSESGPNTGANGYGDATLTAVAPPVLVKEFGQSTIFTGDSTTMKFTITNPSSVPQNNISFTDNNTSGWPAGLTVATSAPTTVCGGSLSTTAPDSLTFIGGSLAAGASCSFSISVQGTSSGAKTNTTSFITSTEGGTGQTAAAQIVVNNKVASLGLTKQVATSASGPWYQSVTVNPGAQVWYRFKVDNTGDAAITGLTLQETAGYTINPAPSCTWPASLAPGDTAYCYSAAVTASSTAGSYDNKAKVLGTYLAANDVTSNESTATYGNPMVTVEKTSDVAYFTKTLDTINYTYKVSNTGYVDLIGSVTVSDDKIPTVTCENVVNAKKVSDNTLGNQDSWLDVGEYVNCTASTLVTDQNVTDKTLTNTATATVGDTTSAPDSATVNMAALTINKTTSTAEVATNGTVTYDILVTNTGEADLHNLQVTDSLPDFNGAAAGKGYTVTTVVPAGFTANPAFDGNGNNQLLAGSNTLAKGSSVTITIQLTLSNAVVGTYQNAATVTTTEIPTTTDDGTNTDEDVKVNPSADLAVTKTDGVGITTSPIGSSVTYTVTLTNNGPSAADGAKISDPSVTDLTKTALGACSTSGGAVCPAAGSNPGDLNLANLEAGSVVVPTLPNGGSISFTVTATVTSAVESTVTNTFSATTPTGTSDPDLTNNSQSDANTVIKATPSITTTASPTTGTVGTQVSNAGDSATLAGGYTPTGSVTFTLYRNNTCTTAVPGMSGSGAISGGSASWSQNWTPTATGTYYWQASYGGDANNNAVTSGCTDANEQIVISAVADLLPVANPDTNTAQENGPAVNGNVLTNETSLGDTPTTVTAADQVGTAITVGTAFATASGGSLTLNANGTYSYTPPAWNNVPPAGLTETFNYTITDVDGDTSSTTLTITVTDNDRLPQADPDTNTAQENGPAVNGNVLTNETSLGDTPTTVTSAAQGVSTITVGTAFATAGGGSLTLNANGTYSYTPPAWNNVPPAGLTETFNYTITDVDGDTSSTTLTITVTDNDRLPVANADTNTAQENGPAVTGNVRDGGVAAGDSADTLGDTPTTVTSARQGVTAITIGSAFSTTAGGSLTLNANGTYSYTPPAWNSVPPAGLVETFNYTITDVDGDTSSTTLTITVTDNDRQPVASADTNTATENGPAVTGNVRDGGVAAGDSADSLGDTPTTVTSARQGVTAITIGSAFSTTAGGSLTINSDGTYTYTPPAWNNVPPAGLTETFNYTITDADGDTSSTTLTITVQNANQPPVANNDSTSTQINTPKTFSATGNDTDSDGTVDASTVDLDPSTPGLDNTYTDGDGNIWSVDASGNVTFAPTTTFTGTATIPYTVLDNEGLVSNQANLSVTVGNNPPTATDNESAVDSVTPVHTANMITDDEGNGVDTDPDSDPLTVAQVDGETNPANSITGVYGTLDWAVDGTYTYTLNLSDPDFQLLAAGATATETFLYTINDGYDTATANIIITVTGADDFPVANDDSFPPLNEDTPLNGDLKPDNGSGADVPSGDGGNGWYLINDATHGTVTVNLDGTFTYVPDTNYNGPDSFIYEICDVDGDCDQATVTLAVSPVDDPAIGIAKSLVSISRLGSGRFTVTLVFHIRNYGDVALMNVQVTDDLSATFYAPSTFTVQSVSIVNRTGAALTKNTAYDGTSPFEMLDASASTLAVGASADITVVVDVLPSFSGPFLNSAFASGMTPTETLVTDDSSDGTDPDNTANCQTCVNGDGNPTNNTKETEINFDANIFDPPLGFKELDPTGLPVLRWTMVWINNNNFPTFASVNDPIPAGTTYEATGASSGYPVPAWALSTSTNVGISCTTDSAAESVPDAETTTTYCFYEPPTPSYPNGRIYWEGSLGPDLGATDQTNANDELYITFTVRVADGVTRVQNLASIDADLNNDTDTADPGEQRVATAQAAWQEPATPVDGREGKKLPATGFAPGKVTLLPEQPSGQAYSDLGDVWLEIPSLGVKTSIVGIPKNTGAWDVDWLWEQAGWLEGTAFPTWQGNSVVTGHVYLPNGKPGPFVNLGNLRFGNQVIVHAFGQRYIYAIQTNHIILPTNMAPFKHEEKAWLTLLTCKGYDESTDTYKYRIEARAVLIKVESE